jgi:carboxymethylenebutenolidase
MCYDSTSRPPIAPISGGSTDAEDIVLTAKDGNRFSAFMAFSTKPSGAQILIYPDVRGLHQFYKELAKRFAENGVPALAIDYFGRSAGLTAREDSFDYQPHVAAMTMPTFLNDVAAGLDYLNGKKLGRSTFIVGFCRGGTLALLTATEKLPLSGIIAFYAGMSRPVPGSKGATLDQADQIRYPVLGLFGGSDPGIPPADVKRLDEQLDAAGVKHEIVSYPGAPHSFFDRKFAEFAVESADAWKRVQDFIAANTSKG